MEYSTAHLDYVVRTFLDDFQGVYPKSIDASDLHVPSPQSLQVLQVRELSRTWTDSIVPQRNDDRPRYRSEDLLSGAFGAGIPLFMTVLSDRHDVTISLGTYPGAMAHPDPGDALTLTALLDAHYPGSRLEAVDGEALVEELRPFLASGHLGLLTGFPTVKESDEADRPTQLDRVLRAMSGQRWGMMIMAEPVAGPLVRSLIHATANELRNIENAEQMKQRRGPLAEAYFRRLELLATEYEAGVAAGMWTVATYFFALDGAVFNALASTLVGVFGGVESFPDPVRVIELGDPGPLRSGLGPILLGTVDPPGDFRYPYSFQTLLNSARLANLFHLPRLEAPGFTVRESVRFDVSPAPPNEAAISLGEVLDRRRETGKEYPLTASALNKHALVVGVTGSGKTNTTFHLLRQMWRNDVPFLVLEPAKAEYRSLLQDPTFVDDLRVFTLGDETASPLRINPFEIEPGVNLATHIDLLKATFNAAFAMWSPLPQVLERCLHEVYRDRGWDPVRGTNHRLGSDWVDTRLPVFPTLADLVAKVREVVDRLGYEDRVTSDIKAALITRLDSLRIGGKGAMLDTPTSVPMSVLLEAPTIVELEQIGDDDEKAFLLGLLLMKLYERRRASGTTEGRTLEHVVVVEEAHRLLANVPMFASEEQSNTRGKAVESFVNMLSEVRAYGQGFLIAEQIPSKLAPDALKNTNLKVLHRTVAGDDRETMARMTNMSEEQSRMLAVLEPGEAIVFAEGDDTPLTVKVPYAKVPTTEVMSTRANSDAFVLEHMRRFHEDAELADLFQPFPTCRRYCGTPYAFCGDVLTLTSSGRFKELFSALVLAVVQGAEGVPGSWVRLSTYIRSVAPSRLPVREALYCVINHGVDWYFRYFGRRYSWSYEDVDVLSRLLASILSQGASGTWPDTTDPSLVEFRSRYRAVCARGGDPFRECAEICADGECLYRYHAQALTRDRDLTELFDTGMAAAATETWSDRRALDQAAARMGGTDLPPSERRKAALCYGVQQLFGKPGLLIDARTLAGRRLIGDAGEDPVTT